MRLTFAASLLATTALGLRMAGNFSMTDGSAITSSCEGTSTYDFTPLETIFVTVDGEYTYTGTINGSTPTDVYYTPPPPCESVIVPETLSTSSSLPPTSTKPSNGTTTTTTTSTSSTLVPIIMTSTIIDSTVVCSTMNTTVKSGAPYSNVSAPLTTACITSWTESFSVFTTLAETTLNGKPHPVPQVPPESEGTVPPALTSEARSSEASFSVSMVNSFSGGGGTHTSSPKTAVTVTVTKKTPVPAQDAPTGGDAGGQSITFPDAGDRTVSPNGNTNLPATPTPAQVPSASDTARPSTNAGAVPGSASSASDTSGSTAPAGSGAGSTPTASGRPGTSPGIVAPSSAGAPGSSKDGNGDSPGSAAPTQGAVSSPGGNGLGSIINSAFNSPFSTAVAVATSVGAASATVTLVAGVPVQVGSSSVYIGGSNVALPTGSSTAFVTIAGQTFTVAPTAVIAGGSTLALIRTESVSFAEVQAATLPFSTITRSGVVVTIEPTIAVVAGTSFAIGLNAPSTTAVVNGQTITFNSNGVAFAGASTTYKPALTTAPAYVVTTLGSGSSSIVISIDSSEAIISGTTYKIGAGALNTITSAVVDGTTISFGPSGIILPSTTIAPTAPTLTDDRGTTRTSASAATRVVSNTDAANSLGGAASLSRPPTWLSGTACVAAMLVGAATLPISLVL